MRVLLIEDEPGLGAAVREHVAAAGHAVDWFQSLAAGEAAWTVVPYDVVLLDLVLPDGRGLDLLAKLRKAGNATPVVIITARDQISDRIAGLNAGADDYLVKPFDLDELTARLNAVARRYAGNPNPMLTVGGMDVDLAARRVRVAGQPVDLTAREWGLLELLLRHPGALVTKGQLEEAIYAFGAEVESNAIEVYISRMRKKLGRDTIETVRGIGYRIPA